MGGTSNQQRSVRDKLASAFQQGGMKQQRLPSAFAGPAHTAMCTWQNVLQGHRKSALKAPSAFACIIFVSFKTQAMLSCMAEEMLMCAFLWCMPVIKWIK